MRLAAEALTEPAFPPDEFEKQKRERLAGLDEQRTDPESLAERALDRWDNPIRRTTSGTSRRSTKSSRRFLDDTRSAAAFMRASSGANELAIVGDFDPAAMRTLATGFFGAWKSLSLFTCPIRTAAEADGASESTPDKANAALFGRFPPQINDQNPDYPALIVADKILGASPESRIPDRVREREGLSYGIQTWVPIWSFEANTPLMLYAIYAPPNWPPPRRSSGCCTAARAARISRPPRPRSQRCRRKKDCSPRTSHARRSCRRPGPHVWILLPGSTRASGGHARERQCSAAQISESCRLRVVVRRRLGK